MGPRTGRQRDTTNSSQGGFHKGTMGTIIHGHRPPFSQNALKLGLFGFVFLGLWAVSYS